MTTACSTTRSDDAGQFRIGQHALCWVHAERRVHQLIALNDRQRLAVDRVRQLIWWFYADLKAYRRDPSRQRRGQLRARCERIVRRRPGFVTLDRLRARLHARKDEPPRALDRPEIPRHTNGSENAIRCHVTKRKVAGGTWSDAGRDARLGLMKTCQKQGLTLPRRPARRPRCTPHPAAPRPGPRPRLPPTARPSAPLTSGQG